MKGIGQRGCDDRSLYSFFNGFIHSLDRGDSHETCLHEKAVIIDRSIDKDC